MPKYIYEGVEVEAIQWNGSTPQATEIINLILVQGGTASFRCGGQCCENELVITINTPQGIAKVAPRDFIVKHPETGEFFSCTPELFYKNGTEVPASH